jgi:transcriptional regulator with XRE-family HTH domain
LSDRAGFDFSYVSRLETGSRRPSREAVEKLNDAFELEGADREPLRVAAGFAPNDPLSYFSADPVIGQLAELLGNRDIPAHIRDNVRTVVDLTIRHAVGHANATTIVRGQDSDAITSTTP